MAILRRIETLVDIDQSTLRISNIKQNTRATCPPGSASDWFVDTPSVPMQRQMRPLNRQLTPIPSSLSGLKSRMVILAEKKQKTALLECLDERLKTIILETIEQWGQEFIEMEVMPEHVHLLVRCDPQFGIHRLVKYIKRTSSRYLRQEYPQLKHRLPILWTNSYLCATVGGVMLETLKRYVEGQKDK